ncbi:hypothetical protein BZL30_3529 [Mycobacterium kansasii]|uniref:Glutamate--cysteine ligase n=1 Tax=Mycobacterium kansasii TaxID=1768 RepID=A0A1V3X9I0_MYCKA|nr:hypothetical protein BZL30_3529 [Mycobacterium kansasii]
MGEEVKRTTYDRTHRREYRRKVQVCLDVFETMLSQCSFDSDQPLTGMEIECNLVDGDYQPAMTNRSVLDAIGDPAYQTELGAYNIEFNVPPRLLSGVPAWTWNGTCGPVSTTPSERPVPTAPTS